MRAKKDLLLLTGVALFTLSLILTRSPKQAAFRSATSYAYPETSALPTDPRVDSHTGQGHHVHDREEGRSDGRSWVWSSSFSGRQYADVKRNSGLVPVD